MSYALLDEPLKVGNTILLEDGDTEVLFNSIPMNSLPADPSRLACIVNDQAIFLDGNGLVRVFDLILSNSVPILVQFNRNVEPQDDLDIVKDCATIAPAPVLNSFVVIGGRGSSDNVLSNVGWRFSLDTDTWTLLPPCPLCSGLAGVAQVGDHTLAVFGGIDCENGLALFDWLRQEWSVVEIPVSDQSNLSWRQPTDLYALPPLHSNQFLLRACIHSCPPWETTIALTKGTTWTAKFIQEPTNVDSSCLGYLPMLNWYHPVHFRHQIQQIDGWKPGRWPLVSSYQNYHQSRPWACWQQQLGQGELSTIAPRKRRREELLRVYYTLEEDSPRRLPEPAVLCILNFL